MLVVVWNLYPDFALAILDAAVYLAVFATEEKYVGDVDGEIMTGAAELLACFGYPQWVPASITLDCVGLEVVADPLLFVRTWS